MNLCTHLYGGERNNTTEIFLLLPQCKCITSSFQYRTEPTSKYILVNSWRIPDPRIWCYMGKNIKKKTSQRIFYLAQIRRSPRIRNPKIKGLETRDRKRFSSYRPETPLKEISGRVSASIPVVRAESTTTAITRRQRVVVSIFTLAFFLPRTFPRPKNLCASALIIHFLCWRLGFGSHFMDYRSCTKKIVSQVGARRPWWCQRATPHKERSN